MSPYLVSTALTTKFDLAESSSYNNLTQVDTVPRQQEERKRKRPASGVSIHRGQLASKTDTLSTLPRDILDKWNRIAGLENLTQLCFYIVKRRSPPNKKPESTLETSDPLDTSIEGQLTRYQLQYQRGIKGTLKEYKQFAEVPWRLYLANIISLYMQKKAARKNAKKRRKRNRRRNLNAANTPRKSVYDIFVDFLLPELLKKDGDTHEEAKRRFDNWIQHGKRWAKLVERFGSGILLLIPQDLSNDK
jgi:hypothetical protein